MKYEQGYWLTREAMKWFWNNYTSNQTNLNEPTVSPLQATVDQLKGLPPALIINGENDVLRDEGEAYALKLLLNAIADDPAPRGAIEQASHMLKKILST
jgi:acetyl esterase